MSRKLKKDFKTDFKQYDEVVVPKGTKVTSMTAMGLDPNYNFVDEFDWIDRDYPAYANILKMDIQNYGINVPIKFLEDDRE